MYQYTWDIETHGFQLHPTTGEPLHIIRPVFFEELDAFGFSQYWEYPKSEYPLLWADGARKYLYNGELVAEIIGGGFYTEPQLKIYNSSLKLVPVDVKLMVQKNAVIMKGLEQKAITTIYEKWNRLKKNNAVYVAFSGGKDSVVLLDLVHRALQCDDYLVVFGDTGMELPDTYQAVEKTKARYTDITIHYASSQLNPVESWGLFGPPSRKQRWCCSVHKSAPSILALRDILGKPVASVLAFDGVRAEESAMRAEYKDEADSYKHASQVNIRPILKWNSAEIFNYIFDHSLHLNHAYRRGFTRAGCMLCPMSFGWRDYLTRKYFGDIAEPYIDFIEKYAISSVKNDEDVQNYIEEGGWMARVGGKNLAHARELVIDKLVGNVYTQTIFGSKERYFEWSKALGLLILQNQGKGTFAFHSSKILYNIEILDINSGCFELTINPVLNPYKERMELKYFRMLANKAAYCAGCRVCEAECKYGALSISNGYISIDEKKCVHCLKCFEFDKGCLVAKSLYISKEAKPTMSYDKYNTFGMEPKWLQIYLDRGDADCKASVGLKQYPAIKTWMREAGLLSKGGITSIGSIITRLGLENVVAWSIIWANLAYGSAIVKWFLLNTELEIPYSKVDLICRMEDGGKERTRKNAIDALFNTLKNTILGDALGQGTIFKIKKDTCVRRSSWGIPDPVVILYSLYRFAEEEGGRYNFTLSQLMEEQDGPGLSPAVIFGLSQSTLESILRGLSVSQQGFINVNLSMGLDNINLSDRHSSEDVLALI